MPAYDAQLFNPPAPLARVSLRHPANELIISDVAMLLDTGADVTLLPRVSVEQLGADVVQDESYELQGFDGSISAAQVARVDLLFLRRAFKGRFLLIDQEWGLLGRDILNHVSLVFDGQRLMWEEQPRSGEVKAV